MADRIIQVIEGRTIVTPGADLVAPLVERAETAAESAASDRVAARLAASSALASSRYFATRAAGEAASAVNQLFTADDGAGNLIFYRRTSTGSVEIARAVTPESLAPYVTKAGDETLSNKTFAGRVSFATNGSRMGVTNGAEPLTNPAALFHLVNEGAVTCGLRAASYWTGSTAAPFQNNDNSLWEVFNRTTSSSLNRSWSGSFANAYNDIPAGVIDSGERTGLIGWSVSTPAPGYIHAGTLEQQLGVYGVAGFQGPGSASTAVIVNATGVRGFIYNDSAGSRIKFAKAGEFISTAATGVVESNIAVYASAAGGTVANYSFYGNGGKLFNLEQAQFGTEAAQSDAAIGARATSNAFEFGNPDPTGYGSTVGATAASGYPFLAFCAEASGGDGYRTRGRRGTVILNDLDGSLVFARLTNANASGQAPTEMARFDRNGRLVLTGVSTHADDAAALGAGLITGTVYRGMTGELRIVG